LCILLVERCEMVINSARNEKHKNKLKEKLAFSRIFFLLQLQHVLARKKAIRMLYPRQYETKCDDNNNGRFKNGTCECSGRR